MVHQHTMASSVPLLGLSAPPSTGEEHHHGHRKIHRAGRSASGRTGCRGGDSEHPGGGVGRPVGFRFDVLVVGVGFLVEVRVEFNVGFTSGSSSDSSSTSESSSTSDSTSDSADSTSDSTGSTSGSQGSTSTGDSQRTVARTHRRSRRTRPSMRPRQPARWPGHQPQLIAGSHRSRARGSNRRRRGGSSARDPTPGPGRRRGTPVCPGGRLRPQAAAVCAAGRRRAGVDPGLGRLR